jgi:hypothetical protein
MYLLLAQNLLVGHHWAHISAKHSFDYLRGTVTGASVLQLLLGGILPGLMCTVMLMLMAAWLAKKRNYPRADRWPSVQEFWTICGQQCQRWQRRYC